MKIITFTTAVRLGGFVIVLILLAGWAWFRMIYMPGRSYAGPLPPLTSHQVTLRDVLRKDVEMLAGQIGPRNVFQPTQLAAAAEYIKKQFSSTGFQPTTQGFLASGASCFNIEVEITGMKMPDEFVIVGAHYDTVYSSPGANDNATGVAALLALARYFSGKKTIRTLRFVAFANEEPPFYRTNQMGSLVYAKRCRRQNENVVAMISLETVGYFTDTPKSQNYPFPFGLFYPSTGNFIGFVGNFSSGGLVRRTIKTFRANVNLPSVGGAIPSFIPGIGWSDHWAFYQLGYPAFMVTDTAPFRYPHYHSPDDTPDKVDYDRTARVVAGLEKVIAELTGLIVDSKVNSIAIEKHK